MIGPRITTLVHAVGAGLIVFAGCGDLLQEPDTGTIPVGVELEQVSGNAQAGAPGTPLAQPLRVRVLDQGEPASRLWVEWSVDTGGGELRPRNAFSGEDGMAEARWILGPSAGAQQVRAVVRNGLPVVFVATAEDE